MTWWVRVVLLACVAAYPATAGVQPASAQAASDVSGLLRALEHVAVARDPSRYLDLTAASADRDAALKFAEENFSGNIDRAVLRERDRQPLEAGNAGGYRLIVAALLESGNTGRLLTLELDVRRNPDARNPGVPGWTISGQQRIGSVDSLYHLALDPTRELRARDLELTAEDLQLHLSRGSVFVATADGRPTALVLLGKGEVIFSPAPLAEREQLRIFSGSDVLRMSFDACLVRINPADFEDRASKSLTQQPPDAADLARAREVFAEDAPRSYTLDIGDVDPGPWSIAPASGDFLAEVHTRRLGQLTYARTAREPEDVTLFDRAHRRTIALYASRAKLAARGRFFDEDGHADYTVARYDVTASLDPARQLIDGRTRLLVRVLAPSLTTLTIRLADSLTVRSASVVGLGRVAAVRVRGQDTLLLALPSTVPRDTQLDVTIAYGGRLPPLTNGVTDASAAEARRSSEPQAAVEPSALYTVPVAWYAQAPTTAYAPATLRLTVPAPYSCDATGELMSKSEVLGDPLGGVHGIAYNFVAERPVPYLACLLTRMVPVMSAATAASNSLHLAVDANPSEQARGRVAAAEAQAIVAFYDSLLGDRPYPSLTLALVEGALPGGNSPAYLAILSEQVAMSPLVWRNDPAAFPGFPEFFIAHEIAHQWWGEAVGTKNYHEQWLSEGLAQYFAALYAEHAHGRAVFDAVMKRMQGWAERSSAEGPIYLGGRLGQLQQDSRIFRAVVYDKGAIVLHMLRGLVGDDAFFAGLRLFYARWRFRKAGTDDLRQAMEAVSHVSLERFFDRWVYADTLPRVKFSWKTVRGPNGENALLRFEQVGEVFDVPISVNIECTGGPAVNLVVPVNDRVVERQLAVQGHVRDVTVNRDDLVPGDIQRK